MEFSIGRKMVGLDHPTYFIADIAANHDGDLQRAIDLIHLCAESGVDAAKFQNFTAQSLVSSLGFERLGDRNTHQSGWKKSVYDVYDDATLPVDWTETLKSECDAVGIDYFTSLYDQAQTERLSEFVCAWKIGSGDITCHEIIERQAALGKPVLIASGASDMSEVEAAYEAAARHTDRIVLMQCNTNYSGSADNFSYIELNVLKTYAERFPRAILGLSDHTPGHLTVLGAVALGARVVEKHFTDDTSREGSDHPFSMTPAAWREMVDRTRELESALGTGIKRVMENETETILVQRRAVRAARNLKKGEIVDTRDLVALRPCPPDALAPYKAPSLIGKSLIRDIEQGDCVRLEDVR